MEMTAVHSSLAAFDSASEDWTEYIECLQYYFDTNGISDTAKQQGVLLSYYGPSTFQLLQSVVLLAPLTELSFKDLVAKMKAHQEPKPSVIIQQY